MVLISRNENEGFDFSSKANKKQSTGSNTEHKKGTGFFKTKEKEGQIAHYQTPLQR